MSEIPEHIDDRYKIIRKLGSGGMADVYLAEDENLDRNVAVKVLDSRFAQGEEFVRRFHREARAAAGLSHPHIVAVHDRGESDGGYYIVMEYLEGKTLADVISEEGPLSAEKATDLTLQVLDAVGFAHEKGVIHRDIKPHNVILDGRGKVKVADFGIARTADIATRMTTAGSILGTSHYLSPEQAAGNEVTGGSDIYSTGVMLYEMITGRVPFEGDNLMAVIQKHLTEEPVPPDQLNDSVPENLNNTVLNALVKDPGIRYSSAQEFSDDIDRLKEGHPVPLRQGTTSSQAVSSNTIVASQVACPSCGVANPTGVNFCKDCGASLIGDGRHSKTTITGQEAEAVVVGEKAKTLSGGKKIPILTVVALAIMLTVTFGAYSLTRGEDTKVVPEGTAENTMTEEAADAADQPPEPVIASTYRGDANHTGVIGEVGANAVSPGAWQFNTGDRVFASPTLSGNTVFCGSGSGIFYALDVATGQARWTYKTGGFVYASAGIAENTVYFGSWDGNFVAADVNTGQPRWIKYLGSKISSSPVVSDGIVYVANWSGYLYAFDAASGAEHWHFNAAAGILSTAAVVNGIVYVGSSDRNLYAVDAANGQLRWRFQTGGEVKSSPAVVDGVVYVGSQDGNLYAVNADSGTMKWQFGTGDFVNSSPAVVDGVVFVGSDDNNIYAVDANTGVEKWRHPTGGNVFASPAVADGLVIVGSNDNSMYILDANTGQEKNRYMAGDIINSSAAVAGSSIYFGSSDGYIYRKPL